MSSLAADPARTRARDPLPPRPRKRRSMVTREQLLRNIEMISRIVDGDILPAKLPSPPASRSASPERGVSSGSKRKLVKIEYDDLPVPDHAKRPRYSGVADPGQPHASTSAAAVASSAPASSSTLPQPPAKAEPAAAISVPGLDVKSLPIRRSRRGASGDRMPWQDTKTKYFQDARRLKYSGHERLWSSLPPSHKSYKPAKNPPPTNSPYHVHAGLVSRLELVDGVVCFMYSFWLSDHFTGVCDKKTWHSMKGYLDTTLQRWYEDKPRDERERAFIGLLKLLEGYIYAKMAIHNVRSSRDKENTRKQIHTVVKQFEFNRHAAAAAKQKEQSTFKAQQPTPPMLPSPASIGQVNSAQSTPRTGDSPTAPADIHAPSPAPSSNGLLKPPQPAHLMRGGASPAHSQASSSTSTTLTATPSDTAPPETIPFPTALALGLRSQCDDTALAQAAFFEAEKWLNLQIMARYFPATFARMVHSTLMPHEELEPDMEDDEGELRWPVQSMTGDGLGWVVYMGRAMVREFGRDLGYKGVEGALSMDDAEASASTR